MENLTPEALEVLRTYQKQRPDIFSRLPLPKKLAEEFGVPIKEETVHLMDYMKSHMALRTADYDSYEEKVACKVTDLSGNETGNVDERGKFVKFYDDTKQAKMRDDARAAFFKEEAEAEATVEVINPINSKAESFPHIDLGCM
jgi:hypothetical protein